MILHQRVPIDGQPASIFGLHLVGYQHVRVQIRVSCARIVVLKFRRYEAFRLDLFTPLLAYSGKQCVVFCPRHSLFDGLVMKLLNAPRGLFIRQRPHHGYGLGGRESKVKTRHRLAHIVFKTVDPVDDFPARLRLDAVFFNEEFSANILD
ncbi:hypothetical protein CAURIM_13050 (plasmid) [Corynebacterium aurimucosum]|nr:hypothetical protein CAURIM_13050 [Corynebacterium aurimucosum]